MIDQVHHHVKTIFYVKYKNNTTHFIAEKCDEFYCIKALLVCKI